MAEEIKPPHQEKQTEIHVLAGDVGATKTNMGFFSWKNEAFTVVKEATYITSDYKNILSIADHFTQTLPNPDGICFGVAGPVVKGVALLSNIQWEVSEEEIKTHTGVQKVSVINDLEATAFGVPFLQPEEIKVLLKGSELPEGNMVIIAPGTGLGEAGLIRVGEKYHPVASEGGHCDFAPQNNFDIELFHYLHEKYGHVSWERLICGPGIVNIYEFLRDVKKINEPEWLKYKISKEDAAAVISAHAGESDICKEAMDHFFNYLAIESANLVLKFKATGGLYIGGGIIPKNRDHIRPDSFHAAFCRKGRMSYLLEKVPVKIILNPGTALLGAAAHGAALN